MRSPSILQLGRQRLIRIHSALSDHNLEELLNARSPTLNLRFALVAIPHARLAVRPCPLDLRDLLLAALFISGIVALRHGEEEGIGARGAALDPEPAVLEFGLAEGGARMIGKLMLMLLVLLAHFGRRVARQHMVEAVGQLDGIENGAIEVGGLVKDVRFVAERDGRIVIVVRRKGRGNGRCHIALLNAGDRRGGILCHGDRLCEHRDRAEGHKDE